MAASRTQMTAEEIGQRGMAIYEERIRAEVETEHTGDFIAIDVFSGDYEVDREEREALLRVDARHPEGLFYVGRIGFPTAHFIGCGW